MLVNELMFVKFLEVLASYTLYKSNNDNTDDDNNYEKIKINWNLQLIITKKNFLIEKHREKIPSIRRK